MVRRTTQATQATQAHNFATSPTGGFCESLAGIEITPNLTRPFPEKPSSESRGDQRPSLAASSLPWSRPTPEEYRIELRRAVKAIRKTQKTVKSLAWKLVPAVLIFHAAATYYFSTVDVSSTFSGALVGFYLASIPMTSVVIVRLAAERVQRSVNWSSRWFPKPVRALKANFSECIIGSGNKLEDHNYLEYLNEIYSLIKKSHVPLTKQDVREILKSFRERRQQNTQIIDGAKAA